MTSTQQALDLLARLLVRPGKKVWMEDPGYFGARIAFETVGAKIVPVPVDGEGMCVEHGEQTGEDAVGAYVTPAHQFPMGPVMSIGRRAKLLEWASRAGAFVIEDDYDSEFRFEGRPIPALMGMDRNSNVILVGSFSKLMFPTLRIGYIVAPVALAKLVGAFRMRTDFRPVYFEQAVLADFIERGHLSRHLHKMRELYAGRLSVLSKAVQEYLSGIVEVRNHHCRPLHSRDVEKRDEVRGRGNSGYRGGRRNAVPRSFYFLGARPAWAASWVCGIQRTRDPRWRTQARLGT